MLNLIYGITLAVIMSQAYSAVANASEYEDKSSIFLDLKGKQITPAQAWRSDEPIFECTKKTVENNKRTGKPRMKKAD